MKLTLFTVIALLLLAGCAQMFTAKTTANYESLPDGTKRINYSSDKEQVGLDASFESPDGIKAHIKVDKSGTPADVVAAVLASQNKLMDLLGPLIQKGATAGS